MGIQNTAVFSTLRGILFAFACTAIISCSSTKPAAEPQPLARPVPANRTLLDANWKFHLGDITSTDSAITADYNDSDWKPVDVPHDYILDGAYADNPSHEVRGHGYLPYDVGWYRKHFVIPATNNGKVLRLDFDGVFRDSQVWLNGQLLGKHVSGYTPFSFDVTKIAKVGGDNTLVVRVDPREFEGWWYEGGGIYRHVYLTALSPVHVAQYGTQVVSTVPDGDKGASEKADIVVKTTLENSDASNANCRVISEIVGPDGITVASMHSSDSAAAGTQKEVTNKPRRSIIPNSGLAIVRISTSSKPPSSRTATPPTQPPPPSASAPSASTPMPASSSTASASRSTAAPPTRTLPASASPSLTLSNPGASNNSKNSAPTAGAPATIPPMKPSSTPAISRACS